MSVNYREHKFERDLKRRVASLEARVVWLEDVLARVLGQPAAPTEAANEAGRGADGGTDMPLPEITPPAAAAGGLDRFLLRTQPMSALAWPLSNSAHGELGVLAAETAAAAAGRAPAGASATQATRAASASAKPAPIQSPLLEPLLEAPADLDAFTLDSDGATPAAIPRSSFQLFSDDELAPRKMPAAASSSSFAPSPVLKVTPPAAAGKTVNLGITAAFETLEGKVAEAAVAELAGARKHGSAAPVIAIRPEMIDAPPPRPRKLDVCCALELLNPSILQQITAVWASSECALRLQRLIGEDFGGRMGLDPQVREELQLLCALSLNRGA